MDKKIGLLAIAVALTCLISCKTEQKKKTQLDVQKTEKDCKDVHWSHHEGDDGPENWKNLCDDFAQCGGKSQSPIDINSESALKENDLAKPEFDYENSKTNIINNGHTVQFNIDGENTVKLNGKNYKLLQFHYHALSEHTIDGEYSPLEVHFVHKHSDTDFAVIGVMYVEGEENELFKKYLDKFPLKNAAYNSDDMIDIFEILPENKSYYYYSGSLTTPPCSEVVNWYVLKNPIEASKNQIEEFSEILHANYRPIQELNGREIKFYQE